VTARQWPQQTTGSRPAYRRALPTAIRHAPRLVLDSNETTGVPRRPVWPAAPAAAIVALTKSLHAIPLVTADAVFTVRSSRRT